VYSPSTLPRAVEDGDGETRSLSISVRSTGVGIGRRRLSDSSEMQRRVRRRAAEEGTDGGAGELVEGELQHPVARGKIRAALQIRALQPRIIGPSPVQPTAPLGTSLSRGERTDVNAGRRGETRSESMDRNRERNQERGKVQGPITKGSESRRGGRGGTLKEGRR
jgi:hypothetical protein